MLIGRNNLDIGTYRNNKYVLKVRFILVIYLNNMRLNINGSIFLYKKTKIMILKKINQMNGSLSVRGFFTPKDPLTLRLIFIK